MADWPSLPMELVELIANRLNEPEDFLSFCATCRSWRLVYLNKRWSPHYQTPWLMLNENHVNGVFVRQFFSLSKLKLYRLPLPEAHGCRCWGSYHGWIVTIDHGYKIFLLNPITRVWISLPPCCTLSCNIISKEDWFGIINKARVFKIKDKLVILVIYGKRCELAFARPGDNAWSTVQLPFPVPFCNVACFRDQIFALSMSGYLFLLQIDGPDPPGVQVISAPPQGERGWQQLYLVESSEYLLMVCGYEDTHRMKKLKFRVYKFDITAKKWVALEEFGDSVLLVDDNFCSSVPAAICFRRNCIYFTVDNVEDMLTSNMKYLGQYLNLYNLKDKSTDIYCIDRNLCSCYTCPIWMVPTLW